MFKRFKRLASGTGTVAYHKSSNEYVVSLFDFEQDRLVALETFPVDGTLADDKAVRQMVKGYVDTYAAAN